MRTANAAAVNRADRAEITEVVESIVSSLSGDLSAGDIQIYSELESLASFIRDAKSEIAALQPHEIREKHLPSATDELDAIVGATADATHTILDAVETVEKVAASLPPETGQLLSDPVTAIYQACSFQDITGQRINKVVKTLKQIENKVDQLLGAFGDEVARERTRAQAEQEAATAKQREARSEHLLNGPQSPQAAVSQADIDALFDKP
ncbi:MAG: protein phosphatase CheZ [Alphaproteobacteria bacterium]|nr:protein phosphatase CheZ [Alphaproteobacteria bacterium]